MHGSRAALMNTSDRPQGRFISLDGPDGGGKTTQIARVVAWLRAQGLSVVTCRDPGDTPLGDRLRSILLDRSDLEFGLRSEMLLFMASRAQLVEAIIRPAIESGSVVVSDRYLLANVVYQGYAGGLPVETIWEVGRAATGGLMPDLTLVLDLPIDVASARAGKPRDRMEDRPSDYHARVRDGFIEASRTYPSPIRIIDASADPDAVFRHIQTEVAHVLALDPRP
jgi:dTMP kinase